MEPDANRDSVSPAALTYPSAFLRAVNRVLEGEGGYTDDPADPGGETKFGISRRRYPNLNISGLRRAEAVSIYYRDFWQPFGYSRLPADVGAKVFDLAINAGPLHAARCLQRALRSAGHPVREDGIAGPKTAAAAARANQAALMAALRSEAAGHYRIVALRMRKRRPLAARRFLKGWLNRAYR